jgi:hypothetical protein
MSPKEVSGLQAIAMAAGGSLSINPDTGLVEASFLKRLIPLAAGVALASTGIGAPLAAGMVGGFETLRTGDISKGLMAGLGAYGGAGLAGSLSTAGASSLGEVGVNATPIGAENVGANALRESAGAGLSTPIPGVENAGANALRAGAQAPVTMSNMGAGFNQVTSTPDAAMAFGKQNIANIGAAAAPMIGDAMTPKGPEMPGGEEEDPRYAGSPYRYNLSKNFQGFTPTRPSPYYRPTGLGFAAQGGSTNDIMAAAGGSYDDEPMGDNFAMGGSIGGYSDGGRMLKGPGDGMSDDIPATIGKRQPARLADGEFVVPADVVSHLGNGSTDAGAKKLYAMMDKVRKARTGKKSQGKQINPNKYLPV